MSKIEELAQRTLDEIEVEPTKDGEPKGDVVLISIAVIGLILKLAVIAWDCWKAAPSKSLAKCRKPNFMHRFMFRRIIRKVLASFEIEGQMEPTYQALLKLGQTLSEDDLVKAIAETTADDTIRATASKFELI